MHRGTHALSVAVSYGAGVRMPSRLPSPTLRTPSRDGEKSYLLSELANLLGYESRDAGGGELISHAG